MGSGRMDHVEAAQFLASQSIESPLSGRPVFTAAEITADPGKARAAYKIAARRLHPDAGGDVKLFQRLQEARRILGGDL